MKDFRKTILSKAFRVIPGAEFNRVWKELWEEGGFVYELVLPEDSSWEEFQDKTFPLFAKYLKSKSLNPRHPSGVVVAVFFREKCYLVKGLAFLDAYREIEGVQDSQELHSKILHWLSP